MGRDVYGQGDPNINCSNVVFMHLCCFFLVFIKVSSTMVKEQVKLSRKFRALFQILFH